ncbi:MAG TPA: HD-GYP domain-containing protein, partial [Clostridiales bacterium]|nr:HD-GYP domain-containing protein [Clostridiales bacterium]
MRGVYVISKDSYIAEIRQPEATLSLLTDTGGMDFMIQEVSADRPCCISPGNDLELTEFFYVLEGFILLSTEDGEIRLEKGDSFYVRDIVQDLPVKTPLGAKLLYVSTKPVFRYLYGFIGDLNELLARTEKKDIYTMNHGKRVEQYSIQICEKMGLSREITNTLAVSSLFHDVGKCFVPDVILNKPGRLTDDERRSISRHPVDSRRLLENKFKERVAAVAEQHHERLDGSGYPYGLRSDEILPEAKIIAVADSYDAMTTDRSYRKAMSHEDAIRELDLGSGRHYDSSIVMALNDALKDQIRTRTAEKPEQ